jgi:hypothetical protein
LQLFELVEAIMSQGIKASLVGIFLTLAGAPELQASSGNNSGGARGRLGPTDSVSDPSPPTGSVSDPSSTTGSDIESSQSSQVLIKTEDLKELCDAAGYASSACDQLRHSTYSRED